MIHLSTGTPGSGKTLNLLDLVEHECKGRDIYYRGIKDLTLPWQELTDDEIHHWFDFPPGSVFVIDEVQQIWPKIPHTRKAPESVSRLDTHRHGGYDFYIVTQASRLLNSDVHSFIDRHVHYQRSSGLPYTKRFAWEKFCKDPDSTTAKKDAVESRIPFNKKTFQKYKSAEIHTSKMRIPKPLIYLGLCVIIFAALAYRIANRVTEFSEPEPVPASPSVIEHAPGNTLLPDLHVANLDYPEQWTPRVHDIPYSAPAYDALTEPKTFPRPQCMRNDRTKVCKCFSQQATALDISDRSCNDMVDNGWFNPFAEEGEAAQPRHEAAAPAPDEPERQSAQVRYIGQGRSERMAETGVGDFPAFGL